MAESEKRKFTQKVDPEWKDKWWKHPLFIYTILHVGLIGIIVFVAWLAWTSGFVPH